jgi:hypothetical protein
MRSAKWVFAAGLLIFCAALAHADNITPPDGDLGVLGGSNSVQITSLSFALNFLPCAGATGGVLADCNLFGTGVNAPQEIFAGINDTGTPWDSLQIQLTLPTWNSADVLGCDGGAFFTIDNCDQISSELITSSSPQTVTIDFMQGGGNGIGCYDLVNSNSIAINGDLNCLVNSINNYNFGSPTGLYDNPLTSSCGNTPDEVCGGSDFVIALGYSQDTFPSVPVGDTAVANAVPEPASLLLLFAGFGLVSLLSLARRKITTT